MCAIPRVDKEQCVGCGKCGQICPAHAITMKNKLPIIDRSVCIHCFCCQEFCPKGAMKVSRPLVARILNK
jgi:Fe-S-cluster-containing hydrogenase component 2